MTLALTPIVSVLFAGDTLTEHDDRESMAARIGCAVWGHAQLLEQLELRLGLPKVARADAVRLQQWSRRMAEVEAQKPGQFYSRSYAIDSIATASEVLAWRDELVMAGWNGEAITNWNSRRRPSTSKGIAPCVTRAIAVSRVPREGHGLPL